MADVLLVAPPYYYKSKVLTSSVKEYAGLGYLAAVLRQQGYSVEVFDADLAGCDIQQTVDGILQRPAPVIGFTALQVAVAATAKIVRGLRAAGIRSHITAGGHFPTFAAERLLRVCPEIDSVVRGEGEYALQDLVQALSDGNTWRDIPNIAWCADGQITINQPRPLIADLDSLPFQARDTLTEVVRRGGPAAIITSRGCYGNCTFCSVNAFYKIAPGHSWRGRSPEHIIDEIEWLVDTWGANIFVFNDDNFFGPGRTGKARAYAIGEELLRRNIHILFAIPAKVNDIDRELFRFLKKAGLRSVFLGIESMVPSDLELYNKHATVEQNEEAIQTLDELGIFYQIGFILMNPLTTLEEVKHNITCIRDKIITKAYCGTQVFTGDLRILTGTALEERFKDDPCVKEDIFHYSFQVHDARVEKLRDIIDQLILKKTFHLMIDCREEFMVSSWQRWLRTVICDLQLSMILRAIDCLERTGAIGFPDLKELIREIDSRVADIS